MNETPLILVVDDDLLLQRAVARLLNRAGYRTCQADNGYAGLQMTRDQKPDLVLLDVVLPDLGGLEVCRQIKTDPALTGCFVVLLSGSRTDSQSQVEGLEGGADGYITRPIPNDELLARVRGLLRIKHAEDQLRESEARYRAVAHSATDAIISADNAGNIVSWNHGAERIFGYTEIEASGQPLVMLLPARYHAEHLAGMARVQAGGEWRVIGKTIEVEGRHKDGREFPLEISLAEWQVAAGRFYTAIIRDITARKQIEATLHESEARYRTLIENVGEGLGLVNPEEQFVFANSASEDIFGVPLGGLLGRSLREFTTPEQFGAIREQTRQRQIGEKSVYEVEISRPDGEKRSLLVTAVPQFDSRGEFVGTYGVFRDITDRRRAEDALRESQSLYHSLVEVSPLSICCKDLAGRFTFANRRFLEESHITLADLVGKTDFDVHPPELAEKYRRDDRVVMDSGQVQEIIEERAMLGGEAIIIQTIKAPIYDGIGQINGVQIAFWDITARRRAEEALRESAIRYRELFENINSGVAMRRISSSVSIAAQPRAITRCRAPAWAWPFAKSSSNRWADASALRTCRRPKAVARSLRCGSSRPTERR